MDIPDSDRFYVNQQLMSVNGVLRSHWQRLQSPRSWEQFVTLTFNSFWSMWNSSSVEKSFLYHCTSSQELLEPQTTSTTAFAWILVENNLQVWHWGPCLVFMCIILYDGNFPTHFRVSGGRRTHLLWVLGLDLDAHQLKLESVSTTNVTCNTFHIRVLFIYINIDQKSE